MLGTPDDVTFPYTFKLYENDGYYQYYAKVVMDQADVTLYHFTVMRGSRPNNFIPDETKPLLQFSRNFGRWAALRDAAMYAMKTLDKYPGDVIPDTWKEHVLEHVVK